MFEDVTAPNIGFPTLLVGGAVRDAFMGVRSKDWDFTVEAPSFDALVEAVEQHGEVFKVSPETFTVRAKVDGMDLDFVMARKDGPYSDGRRPDWVEPGTLEQDLSRRDFTVNALAKSEDGTIIDLFDGQFHLGKRLLVAVGEPRDRFLEDALRVFRAVRFAITKDFTISSDTRQAIHNLSVLDKVEEVSVERIREELHRCFAHDTTRTMTTLVNDFPELLGVMARKGIWLIPSNKEKK